MLHYWCAVLSIADAFVASANVHHAPVASVNFDRVLKAQELEWKACAN